jgi:hypothetical protein
MELGGQLHVPDSFIPWNSLQSRFCWSQNHIDFVVRRKYKQYWRKTSPIHVVHNASNSHS